MSPPLVNNIKITVIIKIVTTCIAATIKIATICIAVSTKLVTICITVTSKIVTICITVIIQLISIYGTVLSAYKKTLARYFWMAPRSDRLPDGISWTHRPLSGLHPSAGIGGFCRRCSLQW